MHLLAEGRPHVLSLRSRKVSKEENKRNPLSQQQPRTPRFSRAGINTAEQLGGNAALSQGNVV